MQESYEIRLGDALKEAWAIFMKGPEVFVSLTFLYFALVFVLGHLPVLGQLLTFLFSSFLPAAFILAAESGTGRDRLSFESLQKLLPIAPQLLALSVAKSILISLGFMLLFLPGIYAVVVLIFAELYLILKNVPFVDAMKASQKLAHENFLGVLGMVIFCGLLAFSGALMVFVGLLLTIPLAILIPYSIFRRVAADRPVVITPEVVST